MNKRHIIAIDGPAGAGKSTISRKLAELLDYLFIDTGAMYRAVGWKTLNLDIPLSDDEAIASVARESRIELKGKPNSQQVFVDNRDITSEIRTPEAGRAASIVSAISGVRRE